MYIPDRREKPLGVRMDGVTVADVLEWKDMYIEKKCIEEENNKTNKNSEQTQTNVYQTRMQTYVYKETVYIKK